MSETQRELLKSVTVTISVSPSDNSLESFQTLIIIYCASDTGLYFVQCAESETFAKQMQVFAVTTPYKRVQFKF